MTSDTTEHQQDQPIIRRIPHDPQVATRARRLALTTTSRVDDLANIIVEDPTLTVEVLRAANRDLDRVTPPLSSVKSAIIRLGSRTLVSLIDELQAQIYPSLDIISDSLSYLRKRAVTTSKISRQLALETRLRWIDECLVAGLLYNFGELFALVKLGEQYQKLARAHDRAHLIFNLQKTFHINLEAVCAQHLKNAEIPGLILSAIYPSYDSPSTSSRSLRPILLSSVELLDAFLDQRLSRFAPGRTPPARSAVRMLSFSPGRYERVFGQIAILLNQMEEGDHSISTQITHRDDESTIQRKIARTEGSAKSVDRDTSVSERASSPSSYSLKSAPQEDGATKTDIFRASIMQATHWIEICKILVSELNQPNLFLHSAIIVPTGSSVTILFNGPGDPLHFNPQVIPLSDELGNFLQSGLTIRQRNSVTVSESPFGAKSYALAGLTDYPYPPMFIYADCGEATSLPPSAEETFREVSSIIAARLRSAPNLLNFPGVVRKSGVQARGR